ncbi:MAG: hypothetical protein EHM28_01165 [Spirochaetaceae bacterium]|nr:MAG: hypothetical protein EHM28_01165 [Spirochaetaceae bacterium]
MKPDLTKLFSPYTDPESDIVSYLLDPRIAPVQQSFYYTNHSISPDNRFLWFYCAFPPSGSRDLGRTLAVADLSNGTITHFPETMFDNISPVIDSDTGGVYWCTRQAFFFRGPDPEAKVKMICKLPSELYGNRAIRRVATHLTFSPDRKELFFDSLSGNMSFAGTVDIASGRLSVWKHFERDVKHAQFCPTDADLVMLAQDNYNDPLTGIHSDYDDRIWLLRRNGELKPLFPQKTRVTHEWWDMDGKHIWAVNNHDQNSGPGIIRIRVNDAKTECFVQGTFWHAKDWKGKYLVYDRTRGIFFRGCPASVHFHNLETGKSIPILTHNPEFHTPPCMYHIDPHPHFSPDGSLVIYTTTVRNRVDVAVVLTCELIERTQ